MRSRLAPLVPLAVAAACARAPRATPPAPVVTPTVTPPAAVTPPAPPVDTLASYRVPEFRALPLITWGPEPVGEEHAERTRTYDLRHQVVRVRFDWERHAVVGSTTLRLTALERPLSTVALDAVGMTIGAVKDAAGARLRYAYDGATLTVTLPRTLPAGRETSIAIDYETVRPRKGAYFVDRRHVVWTQGEMEDTRYWIPTWDYPNDKATWDFHIRVPKSEKALSNGRLVGTRPVGEEVEWHWAQERPASTYLMTAVTGDWVVLQDKWRTVPVGYWTYADSVEAAWRGFGRTPRMIDRFSTALGTPYPWAKYDQVTAPDFIFGGMENVSATTQADDRILHPAWAEAHAGTDGLVAHELGHQWFGDLVTARSWRETWLNEGFATFLEEYFHEVDKGADEGAVNRVRAQEDAFTADLTARRPMTYARWRHDPLELFDAHVYQRGASVLQMLRHQLGDSVFFAGLRGYLRTNQYGSVTTALLRRAMEQASGRDLSRFFTQWTEQAGFPVFRVSARYDAPRARVIVEATEVQPRDSLTDLFDVDVDVKVVTDSGTVRGIAQVRSGTATLYVPVKAPPRFVRWDDGGWLLDLVDFPRATATLVRQLEHDDDVVGRIEAVDVLSERRAEPMAVAAVARAARADRMWAVRERAALALALYAPDSVARAALLDVTRDADPRVRQAAATGLRGFSTPEVVARLRALAEGDSSLYVRGSALGAYTELAPDQALDVIRPALGRDSWLDLERTQAVTALRLLPAERAWPLVVAQVGAGRARPTRQAALRALVSLAQGREAEAARIAEPLLDDPDIFVRQTAAEALGRLGQASSVAALEARRKIEAESRVLAPIDAALAALRR